MAAEVSPSDHGRRRLSAACFDFDGVIVDSEPLHHESERLALARRGIYFSVSDKARFVGGTVRGTAELICRHYGIEDVDAYFAERQREFHRMVRSDLRMMPGAHGALSRLRAEGVPLALVSSGDGAYIRDALLRHGLTDTFAVLVTQQDVSSHKPHPEPYLRAAKLLDLPARQCLAVEDSPTGLASALAAGLVCLAVPGPATVDCDLSSADMQLQSLDELDDELIQNLFTHPGRISAGPARELPPA